MSWIARIGKAVSAGAALAVSACQTAPATVHTSTGERVDQHLSRLEAFGFAGVVLIEKNNQVLLSKGYGLADQAAQRPFTPQTVFDIGSITKQFTAAAILKLEMEGKLSVSDPIARFFENVPSDKQAITLHHLLTHTSGLQDTFGDDYEPMTRDDLALKALQSKLLAPPGERHSYSNAGYSLLGIVIEKVSGQPYETVLHNKLFAPAGMTRTGYRIPKWRPASLAHGYRADADWGTPLDHAWAADGPWWNLRANGGLLSTVEDLRSWDAALKGERILSAAAKAKLTTPYVKEDAAGSSYYGYGWAISTTPRNTKLVAHDGSNGVFYADFRRYIDDGVVVIAASTRSDFMAANAMGAVVGAVFDQPAPLPPAVTALSPAAIAHIAGRYRLSSGGSLVVTAAKPVARQPQGLAITPEGWDAYEMLTGLPGPKTGQAPTPDEQKLMAAFDRSREGDYQPLADVYGVPLAEAAQQTKDQLGDLTERFGPFVRFEYVGAHVQTQGQTQRQVTWVRFVFARGEQVFQHIWRGSNVVSIRTTEGLSARTFLAESDSSLLSFTPAMQSIRRLALEFADGKATSLTASGPNGSSRAVREYENRP